MAKIKQYKEIFLVIVLIIIDQLIKINIKQDVVLIEGVLKLTYVENTGGAFGTFSSNTILIIISNIIIIAMLIRFRIMQKEQMSTLTKISVALIIAGGTSNLLDRIIRGFVIDYIDFSELIKFPVFNFADIMLTMGWILFIIGSILILKKNDKNYLRENK